MHSTLVALKAQAFIAACDYNPSDGRKGPGGDQAFSFLNYVGFLALIACAIGCVGSAAAWAGGHMGGHAGFESGGKKGVGISLIAAFVIALAWKAITWASDLGAQGAGC